ncbi:fas apoptotic inhibitory molecule 3 isoform X3 [Moschus berezovskii]|uniref:fas apoptotic inhibitory molecule 3 isoform X3 n=1 Tax=Moschus berezovskii TaxID=68408 RepID=UPI0024448DEC|nr:fas apoptotic inhibitory molecule 3 isoform X3 [Moschus berezovskii]
MDLWLWALYFLPVGAPKFLPEVKMEGKLGGSVIIECPLPEMHVRIYLCRTIDKSGRCTTVVSSSKFVREEFKHRVSLEQYPDRNLFLVEMTGLTKSDSGVYACGVGRNTDRGKTQQITLTVHSVYEPSWEEEPMPESPAWFNRFLQMHMSPWFQMPAQASSLEFVSKVTTPAQRTESPQAHQASATPSVTHRPRISRASSVATAEPTIFLPSITASKTSAQKGLLRLQTASNNHQTRLHRQKASNQSPGAASGMEDQGVFVLIPTILGLILLALLGLLAKRIVQRRKGGGVAPPPGPEAPSASAPPQVPEIPWLHVPSPKIDSEYVNFCHQPAAKVEDTDSDDYVNVPCLTHLSSCAPGPRPWCQ